MPKAFLISTLIAVSLASAQSAEKLAGGPYVVNVGQRTATVCWIVQTSEARLGAAPGHWTKSAPVLRAEKVTYSGLTPGTVYYYDVLDSDAGRGSFKTAPAGPAAFQFVVYGDTRSRHDMHRKVMAAVAKTTPDFILHTGDLVADGSDTAQWPVFFAIEREVLRKTAFFPSLGNHERNDRQFFDFFDVKAPFYSFDWGTSHFTVLNSDIGNMAISAEAKDAFWTEQVRWLEDDLLKSQKADFRFVAFHHPPFTAVKKRQASKHPVQEIVPLFEKYKVAAVFNGHDHNYQHHERGGVHYVVTGGGGAPLYPVDAPMEKITRKVESAEHYVLVKVDGKQARIEAVALDGRPLDAIELRAAQ